MYVDSFFKNIPVLWNWTEIVLAIQKVDKDCIFTTGHGCFFFPNFSSVRLNIFSFCYLVWALWAFVCFCLYYWSIYLLRHMNWTHCNNNNNNSINKFREKPLIYWFVLFCHIHFVDTQLPKVYPFWNWNQLTLCYAKAIRSSLIVRRLRWVVRQLHGHEKVVAVYRLISK